MHVILTHEQADFDAIAALAAASFLYEGSLPVLPHKINRNARAFISLYGEELGFVEMRDMPAEPITQVTLVDTQSLVTLKGLTRETVVRVIDHHAARETNPAEWSVHIDQVGAITTVLVELLQEHQVNLNPLQATLLLLGIYEDTGSLAYASTTVRDMRAAANLLEQGASLKLAAGYLNPPLSAEQHQVYEEILSNALTYDISSLKIIIATACPQAITEEISSIAHKIRDLLEPDGLFILVATDEGYRLVLRSTTDQLNVAAVATRFGGGGHDRAAAALIHRKPEDGPRDARMAEIIQDILELLPRVIKPSLTVKQLMSGKPRLIQPDMPAKDALGLMQRYGYEGFPVVDRGKIVGLLTRRAVDRALSHKLNLTAASLMEAGEVSVYPGDTIDQLQSVMTDTGWGQIPVIDREKHEIIGIVTRTDLIKVLARPQANQHRRNLGHLLEAALPPLRSRLLKMIADTAREEHMAVYVVGGFVRDLILERPGYDFDIVVEGDAISLARKLSHLCGGRMVSHARFGTAKWYLGEVRDRLGEMLLSITADTSDLPDTLDFITARTEFYDHPTALPTVERSSIKLDLHRRDFTINTLALRLDGRHYGELQDFWGGYGDLRKGLVRVLHSLSFIDDPTRILRAIRFEQRFGFKIEKRTLDLLLEADDQLKTVSGERIRHELDLILQEAHPALCLDRMDDLGILSMIHPSLLWEKRWGEGLEKLLRQPYPQGWRLEEKYWGYPVYRVLAYGYWLGGHPMDEITAISKRIRLPRAILQTAQRVNRLRANLPDLPEMKPSEVYSLLSGTDLPVLAILYAQASSTEQNILTRYVQEWKDVRALVDGHQLRAMGLPPGPAYREIITEVQNAWLDETVHSPQDESALVDQLVQKYLLQTEQK